MATKTALSWEEFLAAGKPGQRWEYIGGQVRFMSPTGFEHGWVIHLISRTLASWEQVAQGWVCGGRGHRLYDGRRRVALSRCGCGATRTPDRRHPKGTCSVRAG